jgi:outer membrane protein assembly factor BamA
MKTRPEGFLFFRKGEFDEDKYATDLGERIPKLFAERGYVDFQLDRDTLMVDRERGKAMIQLDIREGEQYRVKAVRGGGQPSLHRPSRSRRSIRSPTARPRSPSARRRW